MVAEDEDTDEWLVVTPKGPPRKNNQQQISSPPPNQQYQQYQQHQQQQRSQGDPKRPKAKPKAKETRNNNNNNNSNNNNNNFDPIIHEKALRFFRWLHESVGASFDRKSLSTGITREEVGRLFRKFLHEEEACNDNDDDNDDDDEEDNGSNNNNNNGNTKKNRNHKKKKSNKLPQHHRQLEGLVMAALRVQRLMRSQRYDGVVICVFATADGNSFAPIEDRKTARQKLRNERKEMRANKAGIVVTEEPTIVELPNDSSNNTMPLVPMNETITLIYTVVLEDDCFPSDTGTAQSPPPDLIGMSLNGNHRRNFTIVSPTKVRSLRSGYPIKLTFRSNRIAAHRASVTFHFARRIKPTNPPNQPSSQPPPNNNNNKKHKHRQRTEKTKILRDILLRTGDPELYGVLEATKPYQKKKRYDHEKRVDPKDVVHAPAPKIETRGGSGGYQGLGPFRIPKKTRHRVESGEMEDTLFPPWNYNEFDAPNDEAQERRFGAMYATFWQNLLWTSEIQAYDDIRIFDMENVALERKGSLLKLVVHGLAEGRPSVLKGDLVLCLWNTKEYRGLVTTVGMTEVVLEFHASFHKSFDTRVDRIDRVRFTFPRTAFRTAHAGILKAAQSMGTSMLLPCKHDVQASSSTMRDCPVSFKWTSSLLNQEQQQAVREIVKGSYRPLPYVIFGPPGTGKTTTLVEAIYQLAMLRDQDLKILVVAPSNDATDILVEKLSQFFPPSEMVRVLAYTRSIDQVPERVRGYCTATGLDGSEVVSKILRSRITVSTVNMASRLWCTGDGLPTGHFDVLCVDEAGHATEPEIIAVASTVMEYNTNNNNNKKGQLVLAGDPMQLGPIVTSDLCKIFKMDRSYLERLVHTSPAYRLEDNSNEYPPQLVTFLVNNYRSHHHILKLPNEMFYRNQLVANGDIFTTHSMAKWEFLPTKGFPILVHAVDGENTREGNSPSWFNPQEAMVVVDYARKLTEQSKPKIAAEDIGIITPYARQVQKIKLALKVSGIENIKVGSVETFQGQERRVIIISTVRSENSLLQHDLKYNLGFVANEKRFNVAVTRAKALLIVVGNPKVLETDSKNWLPLLRFCKSKKSWLGEDWDEGGASSDDDDDDDEIASLESESGEHDKHEWAPAAQESVCFINREE